MSHLRNTSFDSRIFYDSVEKKKKLSLGSDKQLLPPILPDATVSTLCSMHSLQNMALTDMYPLTVDNKVGQGHDMLGTR